MKAAVSEQSSQSLMLVECAPGSKAWIEGRKCCKKEMARSCKEVEGLVVRRVFAEEHMRTDLVVQHVVEVSNHPTRHYLGQDSIRKETNNTHLRII